MIHEQPTTYPQDESLESTANINSIEIPDSLEVPISPEEGPGVLENNAEDTHLENITSSIEQQTALTEKNQERLAAIEQLPADEHTFVTTEIEKSPEGKSIVATMKEKFAALVHAQGHLQDKLTTEQNYNPKVVKMVGKIGNLLGGIGGAVTFGHTPLGAGATITASKLGGVGALKAFESIANRLPQSMREKLLTKISPEQQERLVFAESEKAQALETHEAKLEHLRSLIDQTNELSPEKRQQLIQNLEHNIKAQTGAEIVSEAHKKHQTLFEKFEHKMPMLATATEYTVHMLIGPSLHALGIGKEILHAIELLAAGGGAEHLTKKTVNSTKHIDTIFSKFKRKSTNITTPKMNLFDEPLTKAA